MWDGDGAIKICKNNKQEEHGVQRTNKTADKRAIQSAAGDPSNQKQAKTTGLIDVDGDVPGLGPGGPFGEVYKSKSKKCEYV